MTLAAVRDVRARRSFTRELRDALHQRGVDTHVIHGSLSASLETVAQRFLLIVVKQDDMEGLAAFMLGGRPWQVTHVDFDRGVVEVKPAEHASAPRWLRVPRHLLRNLCQAIKRVLFEDEAQPYWSSRTRTRSRMESLRAEHAFVRDELGRESFPRLAGFAAPAAVLIRADGHVAWASDETDQSLREALTRCIGPPKTP